MRAILGVDGLEQWAATEGVGTVVSLRAEATGEAVVYGADGERQVVVEADRPDAVLEGATVSAYLASQQRTTDDVDDAREEAARRLAGGTDTELVALGYLAEAIKESLYAAQVKAAKAAKAKKRKPFKTAEETQGALDFDGEQPVPVSTEMVPSTPANPFEALPPVERLAAKAAIAFAVDKWTLERTDGATFAGRLGAASREAVESGCDPIWVVRCASAMHLYASEYEAAYEAANDGLRPLARNRTTAMFGAFELCVRLRPWPLVRDALHLAAADGSPVIERYYRAAAVRAGRAPNATYKSPNTYSLTDTLAAALELLSNEKKEAAA